MERLQRILNNASGNLDSSRTYIPKGDGRMRPLGCPKPEWRILTKAMTECLMRIVAPTLSPNQFGFIPGRNLQQAWEKILASLGPQSQLFEFDLKACFNKINIKTVHEELLELKIPKEIVNYIT